MIVPIPLAEHHALGWRRGCLAWEFAACIRLEGNPRKILRRRRLLATVPSGQTKRNLAEERAGEVKVSRQTMDGRRIDNLGTNILGMYPSYIPRYPLFGLELYVPRS